MGLAELINTREAWRKKLADATADFEKQKQGILDEIRITNEAIGLAKAGIDDAKIMLAEHVIYVRGDYGPHGDDGSVIADAIKQLAEGCTTTGYGKLRTEYLGTKNYDRWHHQRNDCSYGYGPSHGSIVFAVGLTQATRDRLNKGGELTADERDAAVYYLLNLQSIQKAKRDAEAAVAV